jgi:DNA-binding protein WhiA
VVTRLAVRLDTAPDGTSRGGVGPGGAGPGGPPARATAAGGFDWERARDHCRVAWLRGRFLSRGSLSLGVGVAHLELVVDPDEAPVLAARLAAMDMPASWRVRRGRGVVTWKSTERILAFLSRLGASGSVLEAESRIVTRQLHGHLNRVLNAETSNLSRSVRASLRQRQAIARLEAAGRLDSLPTHERSVARLRMDQPEASLTQLAEQLDLSRPRVQRVLERIELAADRLPGTRAAIAGP